MSTPYYADPVVTLYHGDCREALPALDIAPSAAVCDPPYGETSAAWDRWPDGWIDAVGAVLSSSASLWCFGSARMFLTHRDDFAAWRFAQEALWIKHTGSGPTSRDRLVKIHEWAYHWYRGRWGNLHHDWKRVPSPIRDVGVKRKASAQAPHRNGYESKPYDDDLTRQPRSVTYTVEAPSVRYPAAPPGREAPRCRCAPRLRVHPTRRAGPGLLRRVRHHRGSGQAHRPPRPAHRGRRGHLRDRRPPPVRGRDQIGAHLADPTTRAERAEDMVRDVIGLAATILRTQAAVQVRTPAEWRIIAPPGEHRHCPGAYEAAAAILADTLNNRDPTDVIQAWTGAADREQVVDLVCEAAWLARIVAANHHRAGRGPR